MEYGLYRISSIVTEGPEIVFSPAPSHRIGTRLLDLNDITGVSAVARDIAFVVVCIVVTIAILLILSGVRKATQRLNEAMDRVDDLLDTIVAARDSLNELRQRVRSRSGVGRDNSDGGFNVVTWLLTPLGYVIGQRFKRRSQNRQQGDEKRNG